MATKLTFDRRGLHLDCTTSTKPRPKPRTAWPVPEFPTESSWLDLSLEQATQSSRVGIRVASVGVLPGGQTAAWTLQHHAYQGTAPADPDWDETPVTSEFSILLADALPKATHVFRLKRLEADQTHLYATESIVTPDDKALVLTLEGILADDKIVISEKSAFNAYVTAITTEQAQLDAEADTWKCSRTAYDSAITALLAALALLSPLTTDLGADTNLATGGGATLLALFRAVYSARDALKDAIQTAKTGGIGDPFSDDLVTPGDKRQIKTYWDEIVSEQTGTNGLDAQADAAGVPRATYDASIVSLEAYLDGLTGTGGWEPTGNDWRDYTSTYALATGGGSALRVLFVAVWAAATALRNAIGNAGVSDDILTIEQKRNVKSRRDRLQDEKAGLLAQAALAGVSSTAYSAALTDLESHLDSLNGTNGWSPSSHDWTNYTGTYNLGTGGGQTLRAKFSAAEAARDALQGSINEVVSGADWLTIEKKRSVKADYDRLLSEQTALVGNADAAGVAHTGYDAAITALADYMDTLTGTNGWSGEDWANYTTPYLLTGIGSSWAILKSKFTDVVVARDALRSLITEVLSDPDWLTPETKITIKAKYDTIILEQAVLHADALATGVSDVDYDVAVIALYNYLYVSPGAGLGSMTVATYLGYGGWLALEELFKTVADEKEQLLSAIAQARVASMPQDTFRPSLFWDFGPTDAGWTVGSGSSSSSADATYRTMTATGALSLTSPALSDLDGHGHYVLMARVNLAAGTSWDGRLQFQGTSPAISYSDSYMKDIAGPVTGTWREMAWDLRSLTAGTNAYINHTSITGLKLWLTSGSGTVYVDWIALGTYGAGSKADYDLAVASAAQLYMDKATFLDGGKIKGTEIKDASILTPSLGANIIFAKNLVVANFDNLIPNPSSEGAALSNIPSDSIDKVGCINVGAGAYSGNWVRKITCAFTGYGAIYITPEIPCAPGEQFFASAYSRIDTGSGSTKIGFRFVDKDGATTGWSTLVTANTSSIWAQIRSTGTAPANTVSVAVYLEHSGGVGYDISLFDALYFRRMADSNLIVDGAILANHITAGAIQTYHLSVGPLIEFRSQAASYTILKGYSDGTCGRDPAPPSGTENAYDARWYADPSRIYPSSGAASNTYEACFSSSSADRGILLNLSAAFPETGFTGLLVYHAGSQIYLYGMTMPASYITYTPLLYASCTTRSTNDKITVVYYNTSGTSAAVRMQIYLNGILVMTVSDAQLGSTYYGAKSGYAGLFLDDTTVRVWNLRYGKGNVVIENGVVTGDTFVSDLAITNVVRSSNYATGTHSAACTGFKMANTAFDVALITPSGGTDSHVNACMEIAGDVVIAGYKAAKIASNSIGGFQEWTTAGTYTFVVPDGIASVRVKVQGAGGGGGGGWTDGVDEATGGGGGGTGCFAWTDLDVVSGESLSVIVGAAGTAGTSGNGGDGGDSGIKRSTTWLLQCGGGKGGLRRTSISSGVSGGAGGGTSYGTGGDGATNGTDATDGAGTQASRPWLHPIYGMIVYGGGGGGGGVNAQGNIYQPGDGNRWSYCGVSGAPAEGGGSNAGDPRSDPIAAGGGGGVSIWDASAMGAGGGYTSGTGADGYRGGGGGGGAATTSTAYYGGAGGLGFVRLEW